MPRFATSLHLASGRLIALLLVLSWPQSSQTQDLQQQQQQQQETPWRQKLANFTGRDGKMHYWPIQTRRVFTPGDIYLGGLMMVHSRSEDKVCGRVMHQGGLQALESMLFTIDYINNNNVIGDGIRLGSYIKDDCDRDTYGLDQSVDFIKASPKVISGQAECRNRHDNIPLITGVVGAPSSITSNHVASLLKLFDIPQISFFSTAPQLSDKNRFPYFLRTIPSDKYQAEAIVEIIKVFNWSYVSIVYEDSNYGREAFEELVQLFRQNGICPALVETLPRDSKLAKIQDYYIKIDRLVKHRSTFDGIGAAGVVVFGSDQEVGDFMSAVRDLNYTDKFSWIGSDGWGARPLVYKDNNERAVEGAVTVQPLAEPIKGFEQYFLNLLPANNQRNPWFSEFWEDYFECRVPGSVDTPYNMEYKISCSPDMRMTRRDAKFVIEPQLQFVSDAVMAFAVALKNLKRKLCTPDVAKISCIEQLATKGSDLLQELKAVRFTGLTGMDFQFTKHSSDGPPRYKILNFKRLKDDSYQWEDIGLFNGSSLMVWHNRLRFRGGATQPPLSACQPECPADAKRQINPGECRCWVCVSCPEYAIISADREQCVDCQKGQRPSADRTRCEDIALEYLTYGHPIAVVALIFASLGVLGTCFAIAVFLRNSDTAVVKASGKELSFLLLLGILFCYLMTFVLCARPNDWLCGTQQFGVGFAFSICYSALLIKTNRIERIFRAGRRTIKRPRFISPLSQVVMFCLVTSVQIIVLAVWMRIEAPKAVRHFPSRDKHQLVCASLVGSLYLVGLVHPMLLIVVCTFYACLTRNIPEAFNESKHIGFTMYSTCVIWLGFVPCYFSTAAFIHIRIATLCFSISLSATVSLACLFGPKLYIILFRPERNVRQSMMASTRRQHSTRDGSVLHHVNNNNNSNSNCGGDQSQQVLLASSMASARANSHQQSRTDISTQADVELVGLLQTPAFESNESAAESPSRIQSSTQTQGIYRNDCITQTSFHSIRDMMLNAEISRRIYFLSESTEEVQL